MGVGQGWSSLQGSLEAGFAAQLGLSIGKWNSDCCRRERLVERSQKVHGEAKAGDDPADMDVGSRPLTMDGIWPGRSSEA